MKRIKCLLAFALSAFATLAQADTTTVSCYKNVNIGTIKVPGSSSVTYNGPIYFIYVGTGYAGKQNKLENAFKSDDGLDLSSLPDGMRLIGQSTVVDGLFDEFSVEMESSLFDSDVWVTTLIFSDSGYMHCTGINNIRSTKSYSCGNNNTQTGQGASGPGTYTLGGSLQATAKGYVGPYDGAGHNIGVTVKKIPDGLTPTISYGYSEAGPWTEAASFAMPATDVTASPVAVWAKVEDGQDDPVIVKATVTITQRVVTVTAKSAAREWDATALTESGYDVTGFVDGEGIKSLSMTAASTITEPGAVVNEIDVENVVLKDNTTAGNYKISYVNGELRVSERTVGMDVTATPYDFVYDGYYHVFDVAVDMTGPSTAGVEPTIVYSTASNGTYYATNSMSSFTIKNYQSSAKTLWAKISYPGYATKYVTSTVTIRQRPVTIKAGSAEKVYDGTALTCKTYTLAPDPATDNAGFVGSEGLQSVTFTGSLTLPGVVSNKVNAYSAKSGTTIGNYAITKVDGELKVTASDALTATMTGYEGYYNRTVRKATATMTYPKSGTPTITYSYSEEGPFVDTSSFAWPKNATNVTVYGKVALNGYTPKIVSANINIKRRTVVLVAPSPTATYDGKEHKSGTVTFDSSQNVKSYSAAGYASEAYGFYGSQGVTASMTAESKITDPGTQPNVIDTATIKANYYVGSDGSTLDNYIILTEPGTLTVTENTTLSYSSRSNYEGYYDGSRHGTSVTANKSGATILYSLTGEDDSYVPSAEFLWPSNATDSAITVYYRIQLHGYKTVSGTQTLYIKKRKVTVAASSKTWVVDGEWHSDAGFTVSPTTPDANGNGFVAGEGIESVVMTEASKIKEVGSTPNVIDTLLPIGNTDFANYNITTNKGTLTVRNPPSFTVSPYGTCTDKDGNPFNGKLYILQSATSGYDETTPGYLYTAFASEEGLDIENLGAVHADCVGYKKVAEIEVENGMFASTVILINNYTGSYRWMAVSEGAESYMYINNNQTWTENGVYTPWFSSSNVWHGPGHLATASKGLTLTLVKGTGVTDIQTNGVSLASETVVLDPDAIELPLTLVAADGIRVPLFRMTMGTVTANIQSRSYVLQSFCDGDSYTFTAVEAPMDDPTTNDETAKMALKDLGSDIAQKITKITGTDGVRPTEITKWISDHALKPNEALTGDFVRASIALNIDPITNGTPVVIHSLTNASGALKFKVNIHDQAISSAAIESMIQATSDLGDWTAGKLDLSAEIDGEGNVTVTPSGEPEKAFMKVVIPPDAE